MSKNLLVEYINFTKKSIKTYLKFILKNQYNEQISSKYIDEYINVRYYNLVNNSKQRAFYLTIKENLRKVKDSLHKENKKSKFDDVVKYKEKEKSIDNTFDAFDFILFFDNVRSVDTMKSINDMNELLDNLYERREKKYLIKERNSTKNELKHLVKNTMINKEVFLENCFSDKFELDIKRVNSKNNIYITSLKSNIKMPSLYSESAIQKAFDSQIVKEDRLLVEYTLLSVIVIRDIIEADFKDQYITEFAISLLRKKNKLKNVLKIIDDPALQDKINLNIMYEEFSTNKDKIFSLIKKGYKFCITLDNSLKDVNELSKLSMFSYIIIDKNLRSYKELVKLNKKYNIIEK